MAAWPSTLPKPRIQNYTGTTELAFIRTDFDSGFARQRQRFTAVPHYRQVQWLFSPEQMEIFKDFFKDDIGYGATFFSMEIDIGYGLNTYDCRFNEPYDDILVSSKAWQVSATIEVREE